jgi:hypothetical protein
MVVLAYLGSHVQNFTQLGGHADVLRNFILSCISGLIRFHDGSNKGTASNFCKCQKKCDGDPGNDQTSVWETKHEPYTESQNSPRPKKSATDEGKVKSMLIIFFDIKGIVHKEVILAGQTVNSAYYCDVLRRLSENVRRFCPELWR